MNNLKRLIQPQVGLGWASPTDWLSQLLSLSVQSLVACREQ